MTASTDCCVGSQPQEAAASMSSTECRPERCKSGMPGWRCQAGKHGQSWPDGLGVGRTDGRTDRQTGWELNGPMHRRTYGLGARRTNRQTGWLGAAGTNGQMD
jgi:hypothetical protein